MNGTVKQATFALGITALFLLPLGVWYRNQLTTDPQILPGIGPSSLSNEQVQACLDAQDLDWYMLESYWEPDIFQHNFKRRHFGRILCAMGELPLSRMVGRSDLSVRVLVVRSFHSPYMIRVQHYADSTQLVAKELEDDFGPTSVVEARELALSEQRWEAIAAELDAVGFWTLESRNPSTGLDGSDWILEAATAEQYHVVHRWSARELETVGNLLLDYSYLEVGPRY